MKLITPKPRMSIQARNSTLKANTISAHRRTVPFAVEVVSPKKTSDLRSIYQQMNRIDEQITEARQIIRGNCSIEEYNAASSKLRRLEQERYLLQGEATRLASVPRKILNTAINITQN